MDVKMTLNATNMSKEDLRRFLQKIREWELQTPESVITGILFDTDPPMSSDETLEIFSGIMPPYKHVEKFPYSGGEKTSTGDKILRLGTRGIVVRGEILATIEETTLSIGEGDEESLKKIQDAQVIQLIRVSKG